MQPFIPEKPGRSSQSRVPSPPRLVSVKRHHGSSDCCSISQKKKKNFFCCPSCTFEAALSFILLQTVSATFRPSSEPEVHQPRETNKAPSSQITVHTHACVRARAHTLPCRILTGTPSPSERPENLNICLSFAFGLFPLESTQVQNPSLLSSTCQTKTNNNNNNNKKAQMFHLITTVQHNDNKYK